MQDNMHLLLVVVGENHMGEETITALVLHTEAVIEVVVVAGVVVDMTVAEEVMIGAETIPEISTQLGLGPGPGLECHQEAANTLSVQNQIGIMTTQYS